MKDLLSAAAPDAALAETCIAHHRAYLRFRRSLRRLSYESVRVRAARAESRRRQIDSIRCAGSGDREALAAVLLEVERVSDAIAEGELEDRGWRKGRE
jgi:hypothetical protein